MVEQSVENIFKVEKKSFMSQKFSTKQHAKHTRQLFQRIGLWHFGNSTLRLKHFNRRQARAQCYVSLLMIPDLTSFKAFA